MNNPLIPRMYVISCYQNEIKFHKKCMQIKSYDRYNLKLLNKCDKSSKLNTFEQYAICKALKTKQI